MSGETRESDESVEFLLGAVPTGTATACPTPTPTPVYTQTFSPTNLKPFGCRSALMPDPTVPFTDGWKYTCTLSDSMCTYGGKQCSSLKTGGLCAICWPSSEDGNSHGQINRLCIGTTCTNTGSCPNNRLEPVFWDSAADVSGVAIPVKDPSQQMTCVSRTAQVLENYCKNEGGNYELAVKETTYIPQGDVTHHTKKIQSCVNTKALCADGTRVTELGGEKVGIDCTQVPTPAPTPDPCIVPTPTPVPCTQPMTPTQVTKLQDGIDKAYPYIDRAKTLLECSNPETSETIDGVFRRYFQKQRDASNTATVVNAFSAIRRGLDSIKTNAADGNKVRSFTTARCLGGKDSKKGVVKHFDSSRKECFSQCSTVTENSLLNDRKGKKCVECDISTLALETVLLKSDLFATVTDPKVIREQSHIVIHEASHMILPSGGVATGARTTDVGEEYCPWQSLGACPFTIADEGFIHADAYASFAVDPRLDSLVCPKGVKK